MALRRLVWRSPFLAVLCMIMCSAPAAFAQNNSTNGTNATSESTTVIVTYDPASAKTVATYIVAACALFYASFVAISAFSWFRFRIQILPAINMMKNVEVEHVSLIMSYWPRVRKQFQENFPLVLYNIIWAALNLFGYVLLQTANFNTGSLLIFLSTSMSFFGITILFMPNHNLVKPPPEMSQAQAFIRKHPAVELDKYYVVSDETLESWWDRPESWSFEAEPWGTKNLKIERAVAVPKFEVPAIPIPKPVQIDEKEEEENRREERAAEIRRVAAEAKAEEQRRREERKEATKVEGQEEEEEEEEGEEEDLEAEEEEEEEEVGPEYDVSDKERQRRLTLAWLVDPRSLVRLQVEPPAGVCTVLADYPLPTWQRVSYFEVYIVSGEPNLNIMIGLTTRPYPQWRFAGWEHLSIGYHCRGVIYVSTCDFEKEYSMPWGPEANEEGLVNGSAWQEEIRNIQDEIYERHPNAIRGVDPQLKEAREACQTWDCVGVMYNRKTGRVRYSLNGRLLPPACHLPGRLFYPAISCDGKAEFRVNFGTQPFYCSDFNYIVHGLGRSLRDPNDDESDAESEAPDSEADDGENDDDDQ